LPAKQDYDIRREPCSRVHPYILIYINVYPIYTYIILSCMRWRERRADEVVLGESGAPATLDGLVGAFFSVPSGPQRTPWEVLLVRGVPAAGPPSW
jgi:hypothetical protein